jgi:6-phosphogluconolactonase
MTRLTTMPDEPSVAERATREIARHIAQAQQERGVAHLALSGGHTPRRTYELLSERAGRWDLVRVWFIDERCVPPDDEQSNYLLAERTLLGPAAIAPEHVHRMEGELGPEEGARRYRELMERELPPAQAGEHGAPAVALDVAVLGIGPDGHVASLFPGSDTLDASALCLPVHDSPKPPPERITVSLGVLRSARRCVLVATGASKADALSAAMAAPSRHVPASLLRRERLTIIADDAASPPAPHSTSSGRSRPAS